MQLVIKNHPQRCMSLPFERHSYVLVCHPYVLVCHPYVTRMYPYVICMYSYVLVCHPYVTGMYSNVIRVPLVCTRMSSVCHWHVLECHPCATRNYSYVIRMSLVCGFTMNLWKQLDSEKKHSVCTAELTNFVGNWLRPLSCITWT